MLHHLLRLIDWLMIAAAFGGLGLIVLAAAPK